jgi:hypothetical protein
MGRTTGSKNKQVSAQQLNAILSVQERIEFLANLIVERLATTNLAASTLKDEDSD